MTPDILAQTVVLALVLLGLWKRDLLDDLADGNVERLEKDDHAAEAAYWLQLMERGHE